MNIDIHLMNYPQFQFRDKLTSETERRGFFDKRRIPADNIQASGLSGISSLFGRLDAYYFGHGHSGGPQPERRAGAQGFSRRQLFRQA